MHTIELDDTKYEDLKRIVNNLNNKSIKAVTELRTLLGLNKSSKTCLKCNGKGKVKSAVRGLDGYDLEDCPDCEGRGFIK